MTLSFRDRQNRAMFSASAADALKPVTDEKKPAKTPNHRDRANKTTIVQAPLELKPKS